jgi:hypothetical protein
MFNIIAFEPEHKDQEVSKISPFVKRAQVMPDLGINKWVRSITRPESLYAQRQFYVSLLDAFPNQVQANPQHLLPPNYSSWCHDAVCVFVAFVDCCEASTNATKDWRLPK